MKKRDTKDGVTVHAIAGAYVVLLGFDVTAQRRNSLLGFAVKRTNHATNEDYWLPGMKTFQEIEPHPAPDASASTLEHPIQGFRWGDYTAKPGSHYTYTVQTVYGTPTNRTQGPSVSVDVTTEDEDVGTHAVYFNRGVAGSQAYAKKFHNQRPDKVGPAAWKWLSRGLEEAMLAFIGQASSPKFGLRAAVYEFNHMPVLQAFKAAGAACRDVSIVYDARPGKGHPVTKSNKAIKAAGIGALMIKRTSNPSYIAHNKFIVLLEEKQGTKRPVAVWTGSTNFTASGIFGQSNVGHVVRDPALAAKYLAFWERLAEDPAAGQLREDNLQATPDPSGPPQANAVAPVFSPRPDLGALTWYAGRLKACSGSAFFTAAFGVNKAFQDVFAVTTPFLRYVLLEKTDASTAKLREDHNCLIAYGAVLDHTQGLHQWLEEQLTGLSVHVKYIHNKFLLLDPLSNDPVVISGSANFSDASTKNNDENMLVIRGDTRVADIYLGEFMRLWDHFRFRDVANRQAAKAGTAAHKAAFLRPDDSWTDEYFKAGSTKAKQRALFA